MRGNKQSGFTLIEVLVTLGIVMILSSILMFSGREGNQTLELKRAAQELIADMRRTQSYALSARDDISCQGAGNRFPSWGLDLIHAAGVPGHYFVFGNCNASKKFETETSDALLSDVIIENVSLRIISPSPYGNPLSLNILFIPPVPTTEIRNNSPSFILRLNHLDNLTKCMEVRGNSRGNIWLVENPTTCL